MFHLFPPSSPLKECPGIFHDFHLWKHKDVWSGVKLDDSAAEQSTTVPFVSTFPSPGLLLHYQVRTLGRRWCQAVTAHCLPVWSRPQAFMRGGRQCTEPSEPSGPPCQPTLPCKAPACTCQGTDDKDTCAGKGACSLFNVAPHSTATLSSCVRLIFWDILNFILSL